MSSFISRLVVSSGEESWARARARGAIVTAQRAARDLVEAEREKSLGANIGKEAESVVIAVKESRDTTVFFLELVELFNSSGGGGGGAAFSF